MDYYYDPRTTFHLVDEAFIPSNSPNSINIHFHFTIQTKFMNLYRNHDSSLVGFSRSLPPSAVSASVPAGAILFFDQVEEAVGGAMGGRVPATRGRLGELVDRAWERVRERFSDLGAMPRECDLHVAFHVAVEHRHVYVLERESPFEIPAAEAPPPPPAFELLEEYEEEKEEEKCCCICLEGIGGGGGGGGGGGALRMPCKHAFHGECIKKWLRKKPCCPLCRYEMPMV